VVTILVPDLKTKGFETRKFIDYDKLEEIFYDNLYLDEFKICVKIPIICKREPQKKDLIVNKFNLEKYTYLLSY
jgi:hypothetical protein